MKINVSRMARRCSLRQARQALQPQNRPQRNHRIIDVATASGVVQPFTPAKTAPPPQARRCGRARQKQAVQFFDRPWRREAARCH
jgi:hypothetical protein